MICDRLSFCSRLDFLSMRALLLTTVSYIASWAAIADHHIAVGPHHNVPVWAYLSGADFTSSQNFARRIEGGRDHSSRYTFCAATATSRRVTARPAIGAEISCG